MVLELMTPYVMILIGSEISAPLGPDLVDHVIVRLQSNIKGVISVNWLAENEACDIYLESELSSSELAALARQALSGYEIDVVCTAASGRRKKILISDMDSTVINQECIDELGEEIGIGDKIREITTSVINDEISFPDALRQRMTLMENMDESVLDKIYRDRISLMSGARVFVQTMRHHGAYCVLVSGGFTYFTSRIHERLGFHDHEANELAFKNGKLTGEVVEPILGRQAKFTTLNKLCAEKNVTPSDVLAVGDGANDIKMIEAAGLGVAYHGTDSLKEKANAWIDYGDLTALLYIQGYRKSDFIYT